MKITERTQPNAHGPAILTPSWRVEYEEGACVFEGRAGSIIAVEGEIHYTLDDAGKPRPIAKPQELPARLKRIYDEVGWEGLSDRVEGHYIAAVVDAAADRVEITADALGRRTIFYLENGHPAASTDFRDLLAHLGGLTYDPAALYCILVLSYCPAQHTPYRGLRSLAAGERLMVGKGKVTVERRPLLLVSIRSMGEPQLNEYADLLENAVLSRASAAENWVEISGGWDSTVVLGILRKHFDAGKVRAIVNAFDFRDGRRYNPPEVDKSVEIARHYGVPIEIVSTDFGDGALPSRWERAGRIQGEAFAYFWLPAFHLMADRIREKARPGAAVFVGSFSDAVHNFGFSQFASLPYLSYDFRAYSDKLMSYLYSPSFLRKVLEGKCEDDFAYRLFRWHHERTPFADAHRIPRERRLFEYLLPFILGIPRVPFAALPEGELLTARGREELREWLYEHYFKETAEHITPETMYFWLIRLYQHFHLQGSEKIAVETSFRNTGLRPCWPFLDLRLVRFLEAAPEDWGRGLEWRPTKYPLKVYAREKLRIPYEIVESGVHSYIDELEAGHAIDWRAEVIGNSTLTPTLWERAKRSAAFERIFDPSWFNLDALAGVLKTGRSGTGTAVPLNLLTFLSSLEEHGGSQG